MYYNIRYIKSIYVKDKICEMIIANTNKPTYNMMSEDIKIEANIDVDKEKYNEMIAIFLKNTYK